MLKRKLLPALLLFSLSVSGADMDDSFFEEMSTNSFTRVKKSSTEFISATQTTVKLNEADDFTTKVITDMTKPVWQIQSLGSIEITPDSNIANIKNRLPDLARNIAMSQIALTRAEMNGIYQDNTNMGALTDLKKSLYTTYKKKLHILPIKNAKQYDMKIVHDTVAGVIKSSYQINLLSYCLNPFYDFEKNIKMAEEISDKQKLIQQIKEDRSKNFQKVTESAKFYMSQKRVLTLSDIPQETIKDATKASKSKEYTGIIIKVKGFRFPPLTLQILSENKLLYPQTSHLKELSNVSKKTKYFTSVENAKKDGKIGSNPLIIEGSIGKFLSEIQLTSNDAAKLLLFEKKKGTLSYENIAMVPVN